MEMTDQAKRNLIPLTGELEGALEEIEEDGDGVDSDRYQATICNFNENKDIVETAFPELDTADLSGDEYEKIEEMVAEYISGQVC
ncbi:MAG: hypothetical protein ACXQTL_08665 [Methanosarcinales archaeon]